MSCEPGFPPARRRLAGQGKLVCVTSPSQLDREQGVRAAARNNAEWCDAVCRSHGLPGEFNDRMWTSAQRTPPLYPDAVTLAPTATAAEALTRIDSSSGCSVKDSFACLDLARDGFTVLFDAWWIYRPAAPVRPRPRRPTPWVAVRSPDELLAWEIAWYGGDEPAHLFRPELLHDETVLVLAGYTGPKITAGVVANRSASVIGLSNLFGADGLDNAWSGALAAVAEHFPTVPIVGYEHNESLDVALRHGFAPLGPVRVWAN